MTLPAWIGIPGAILLFALISTAFAKGRRSRPGKKEIRRNVTTPDR
jgi:hypothetical protein